ncbi:MAG: amidohydrolase family protein [Actinobacteria bacterium]|nr:amidohydrolase family protein [Actinomycetota bacterium]MBW3651863.1 amidohydrolase family protein [Actinomycetota bacterium]
MLALRATRLFDGESATLVQRPLVLIDSGRIVAVDAGAGEPPAGAEVVELGDVTLIPGLVDTHVHLGFDASADPVARMRADDDGALLLRMRLAAQQHLVAGVTTVRDLGDRGYLAVTLRDWFREGHEVGPEVLASGPPLTVTGGHCHFMGGQADDEAELRRGVRTRCTRGVDVIKVMVTGGNMTAGIDPLTPQYTAAEIAAVVEEAHRFGRTVTAHVHGVAGIEAAVDAGVDGLEHCGFWVAEGVRADQELIDRIAGRGITVCPTLGLLPGGPPPPPPVASRIPAMSASVGRLHKAGVRLVGGTDAGIAPAKPHGVAPYVVDHLLMTGLTSVEALRVVTSAGADACGLGGRKGRLVPGADADVVAVAGNPLVDPQALRQPAAVFRAGVRVRTPVLS